VGASLAGETVTSWLHCLSPVQLIRTTCPSTPSTWYIEHLSRRRLFRFCVYTNVSSYLRTLTTRHCPHSPAARRCCSDRSASPARLAHSSKSAAAGLLLWDRQTDGRTPCRFVDPAVHTVRALATSLSVRQTQHGTENISNKLLQ